MNKPRNRPQSIHIENVTALFDQLSRAAPAAPDWLETLRQRALKKDCGWKVEANSYAHGLIAAGALTPEAADACRKNLELCQGSNSKFLEIFLLPIGWIAIVAAFAVSRRALVLDWSILAALVVLTAVAGALWARKRPWLDRFGVEWKVRWERRLLIGACVLLTPFLTCLISQLVGDIVKTASIEKFKTDQEAFFDDPKGFPFLQKLAREQYGLEVMLGSAEHSWALTTLKIPNASSASMTLGPGYCILNMYRSNVLRDFAPPGNASQSLWVQGVMMHEFAHCFDEARDMPAFGQRIVGTRSLGPTATKQVKDIQGYLEASASQASQLWREAVADIFAVGFWKLTAPDAAGDLIAGLRRNRAGPQIPDPTHATMCWIDHANKAVLPATTSELFNWADRLRSLAPCDLPEPKPKKLTDIQKWMRGWL